MVEKLPSKRALHSLYHPLQTHTCTHTHTNTRERMLLVLTERNVSSDPWFERGRKGLFPDGYFWSDASFYPLPFVLVCPMSPPTPISQSLDTHIQPSISLTCLSYLDAWPIGPFVWPQRTWPTPWFESWDQWWKLSKLPFFYGSSKILWVESSLLYSVRFCRQLVNRPLWRGWGEARCMHGLPWGQTSCNKCLGS